MLDRGADPSMTCKADANVTMLHLAIREGAEATAKLLVERGANLHAKDAHGKTPMDMIRKLGPDSLKRLMEEKLASSKE